MSNDTLIIDQRNDKPPLREKSDQPDSSLLDASWGTHWRLVTDQVMGGVSNGDLSSTLYAGKPCLHLQGDVSLDNNGGFVQMALDLYRDKEPAFDASNFSGIELEVAGNGETYNLHLRTTDLSFPWQSFRGSFPATADWTTVRIPFSALEAHRTEHDFQAEHLKRLGLVAIGHEFHAELYLASIKFYRD